MPKIVDHDEHRKVLLKTCFDLFARKGFRNVTMREIATEIGVSTGAVYHYFPTKEHILEQMFAWAVEDDIEAYGRRTPSDQALPERLGSFLQYWLGNERYYQNLLLLALDQLRTRPAESVRIFQDFVDHYRAAVANILGASPRVSDFIITYLLGLVVRSVLTRRPFASAEQAAFMRDALASLLVGPNGRSTGSNGTAAGAARRRTNARRRREPDLTSITD